VKTGKYTNFGIEEDQLNCEWHLGTKLDYLMPERTKMLRTAEIDILTKICDIERTQLLTILAPAPENSELAGYLLTNN
jgi:hypothetical protein